MAQFTSSDIAYEYRIFKGAPSVFLYTEGVRYVALKCEAFWLLDAIASYQPKCKLHPKMKDFQIWELKKTEGNKAMLTGSWDDGKLVYKQKIEFTDFPLASIKLYLSGGVLLLPSEY